MIATILGIYVLAQLAIAVVASRFVRSETDYLLAGRNLGLGVASVSLFATWFGAETVIGSSGAVAAAGLSGGRTDPFGYTICLVLMALLLAERMRARNYVTLGDYFRERFGAVTEKVASLIMVPTSMIWAAAQILAFASIIAAVTELPVSAALLFTVVIVVVYSTLGGLLGDIVTDLVQGAVVVIGLTVLLWLVIDQSGGMSAAFGSIEAEQLRILAADESLLEQLDGWMIPILGSLVAQEAMSRLLATRSAQIARRACLLAAGVYLVIGALPVLTALIGSHLIDPVAEQDTFLPQLALAVLPPVLYVVFLGALLSAILSTIDSALLAVTALVGHNIIVPLLPGIGDAARLRIQRLVVAISGTCCYFIAIGGDSIFGLVELASAFGSGGLLICVLIGLHWRIGGPRTALATLATGMLMTLAGNYVFNWPAPYLAAVAASLAVYLIGGMLERRSRD